MTLVARYRVGGEVRFGIVDGTSLAPIQRPSMRGDAETTREGVASLATLEGLRANTGLSHPLRDVELLTPVPHPAKIICVGANYPDHVAEHGQAVPPFPNIFAKFPSSVLDPGKAIVVPPEDMTVDYEGELCVVIGRRARRVRQSDALSVVAGYTIANDVSARGWQLRVSQWTVGKSFDSFCPVGPWLATHETIPDPQDLSIKTRVGTNVVQQGHTREMVYSVADIVEYLSRVITLEVGDLILTGTPEGVGHVKDPPRYLAAGETVSIEVERIGVLSNPIVGETDTASGED